MGIPQHYSRELPERCMYLIDELLSKVEAIRYPGQEDLGPLTTTFLLAMATPMVSLPIERVERHRGRSEGYMDERCLNPHLAATVDAALGNRPFCQSPFFQAGHWRFARIAHQQGLNLARHFPEDLVGTLSSPTALDQAARLPASEWASCLRNALSHGGIVYLDENGRQISGEPTNMIAFVSGKYSEDRATLISLKVLRINRDSFLSFLRSWVNWLRSSGLSLTLAA